MKNYLKSLLYIFGIIFLLLFFLTIFNYFNIITGNLLKIIKFIIPTVAIFTGGIILGKNSPSKGWYNGIKLSLIVILLFIILNLIFRLGIEFKDTLYYLILLASSTLGSMVGINKKHQ